jgi:hypothetical protein
MFLDSRAARSPRATSLSGLAVAGMIAVIAGGCAAPPTPVNHDVLKGTRYVRYTLRSAPEGYLQGAFKSNYLSWQPFANGKVGSKVQFVEYTDQYVDLSFNGIRCRMHWKDMPFPTDPDGVRTFVEKHFAATQEELNLEALDKDVRRQIDNGVAAIPMTKDQVFMALGYPSHIDNHVVADPLTKDQIFASNNWIYRSHDVMLWSFWWVYQFNDDGKLANVIK